MWNGSQNMAVAFHLNVITKTWVILLQPMIGSTTTLFLGISDSMQIHQTGSWMLQSSVVGSVNVGKRYSNEHNGSLPS